MFKNRLIPITLTLLISPSVFALNLQGYHFSDSYRYSLLDDSLMEKFEGQYVVTASYGNVQSPFYYSDSNLNDLKEKIIDYNQVLTAGFSYYLNKNVSFGIDVNAINNKVFGQTYTTLADTVVKSRINIRRTDTFSLSLNPQIILPTGDIDNFSTMGSVSGSLSVVAEKTLDKLHFLASLGALSSKNNVYEEVDHRQLLLTQLGVSYDLSDRLNLNFETFRNFPMVDDKLQDEGKYFVTAKHKTHERFSTYGGAGVTGWDRVERKTYSLFVGIKIHEKPIPEVMVQETVSMAASAPQRQVEIPHEEIYFSHARYDLEGLDLEKLDHVVQYFHNAQGNIQHISIGGYASAVGSNIFNMKLSQKRANTVRKYFIKNGLPDEMLSIQGYGEDFTQDPQEYKNRKVQFKIQK